MEIMQKTKKLFKKIVVTKFATTTYKFYVDLINDLIYSSNLEVKG